MRRVTFALTTALASSAYLTRTQRPEPHLDAATVRQNRKDACRGRWDLRAEHGTVTAQNAPLLRIISRAFELTDGRVIAPSWLETTCYDIQADLARRDR